MITPNAIAPIAPISDTAQHQAPTPTLDGPGRLLLSQSPNRTPLNGAAGLALLGGCLAHGDTTGPNVWSLCVGCFALAALLAAYWLYRRHDRTLFHENEVRVVRRGREARRLRWADVRSVVFFDETDGDKITSVMEFHPADPSRDKPLSLRFNRKSRFKSGGIGLGRCDTLTRLDHYEEVRSAVARHVAPRLLAELAAAGHVNWVSGPMGDHVDITPDGLRVTRGLFRRNTTVVPWHELGRADTGQPGWVHLTNTPGQVIADMRIDAANFWVGFVVLRHLGCRIPGWN